MGWWVAPWLLTPLDVQPRHRGGINRINQHPGVHEEAGTPPVEFLAFVGPHELQIYLPKIDHSSRSYLVNLDQLSSAGGTWWHHFATSSHRLKASTDPRCSTTIAKAFKTWCRADGPAICCSKIIGCWRCACAKLRTQNGYGNLVETGICI